MTNHFGGLDVAAGCHCRVQWTAVPFLGPIARCYCSVLWLAGMVTANFGGVDVVPLLGAQCAMVGGMGG